MKTISEHILDIVQNSIRANSTLIEIIFEENKLNDLCIVTVKDNGDGMDEELVQLAVDPFFTTRTTRKTGLGLSLLQQHAKQTGGFFEIQSKQGEGTAVRAGFRISSIDRQPVGDIAEVIYLLMLSHAEIRWIFRHQAEKGIFELDSEEMLKSIEGVPLKHHRIRDAVIELIRNNLDEIEAMK